MLIKIQKVFIKHANLFRQFVYQNADLANNARFYHFIFYRFSILSFEPPILAAYNRDYYTEQLRLAIIRFNMQAASFEFLRKPVAIQLDAPRNVECAIVDNRVCVFRVDQPAYFASYKFDERWQLVDRQVHLSEEANVQLFSLSRHYFACSRL